MDKEIVISIKTIILTLLLILAGYIVYVLGPVIGIILVAALLVVSLEPAVQKIMKVTFFNRPVPRGVAVIISYIIFVLVVVSVFTFGLPPVLVQFQRLVVGLSNIDGKLGFLHDLGISFSDFLPAASEFSSSVVTATLSVFSNIAAFVSVLIVSIYMSMDWENIKRNFIGFFPKNLEEKAEDTIKEVENNVGNWVKGQLLLMLIIGTTSFLGLLIIGVRYPLALGLVAGVLEIVPALGPLISAVIAAIVGFAESPAKGIGAVALFVIIQQLENDLLVPKIMQKVSGFSPLIILIALLVGGEFFGILGVLVAVPTMMILTIILKKVLDFPQ
ncbi:AI-2E family transporter [Patescibacteria group bacterium]|nr:AI-2E family transporter [Patescibacteria group bacterium]